ncbi:MAG: hypothetical protein V1644_00710 [Candidatus Micrarchaeota archaeon]
MASSFIEIDAIIATLILITILITLLSFVAFSTAMLKEKVSTFKQMQSILAGNGDNCISVIEVEENKLRRTCSDSLA